MVISDCRSKDSTRVHESHQSQRADPDGRQNPASSSRGVNLTQRCRSPQPISRRRQGLIRVNQTSDEYAQESTQVRPLGTKEVDDEGEEWTILRAQYPNAVVIVVGNFNQNLGAPHCYGTKQCRYLLRKQLVGADLLCRTDADEISPGTFVNPPIDHVCVGVPAGKYLVSNIVIGWEGTQGGVRLSDHSAVVAEMSLSTARPEVPDLVNPSACQGPELIIEKGYSWSTATTSRWRFVAVVF